MVQIASALDYMGVHITEKDIELVLVNSLYAEIMNILKFLPKSSVGCSLFCMERFVVEVPWTNYQRYHADKEQAGPKSQDVRRRIELNKFHKGYK